jgi:hypothetical protein
MTLRRLTVATLLLCGLCVWGYAHSGHTSTPVEPAPAEGRANGTHDDAEARYRSNQSRHWRYVALGNRGTCP